MASPWIGSNTSPTSNTEDADAMPHVIVKLWRGKSEQQNRRLAQAIDEAYRTKYAGSPYLKAMVGGRARAATVRVMPRG